MKRIVLLTGVLFAVALAVDLVIGSDSPGFDAAYGLISCLVIIIGSKWLGRFLLQRREDYYEQPSSSEAVGPSGGPSSSEAVGPSGGPSSSEAVGPSK